ncbi:MAG: DNA-processing protein DprA [Chitinophagaceae bacterium]|nr:DNA-processing protein DprA [Chitinophagaceae bacterium]
MADDLLYKIALTLIPNIGAVQARILMQHFTPEEVFRTKKKFLESLEGIGPVRANSIHQFKGFPEAEREIEFIEKYKIKPLFLTDPDYPQRLLHCYDPPTLLYYKGEADLNCSKIISIVGSRTHTDYGKQMVEEVIQELAAHQVLVVSGLAYGIDTLAHKYALKNKLPTVGVLAHGLDQIYPPANTSLAKEMIKEGGGLLTEFRSGTKPDKHNFPIRNRIVAGLSDAVIVAETGIRGGSMITAELANGYNRDVFAIPGRIGDSKSEGTNYLIRQNKAILLAKASDVAETLGWKIADVKKKKVQKELFVELTPEEKMIYSLLKEKECLHIDEIHLRSALSSSVVAAALLNMELNNIIVSLPGKLYKLC